jgi:hypothetical protein
MKLPVELYAEQQQRWPAAGRHILAHYDDASLIVYQAYRPAIGRFALAHGFFGGEFSYNRMSWIKPNFLWMMYRSGWGTKEGQEIILALRLRRTFFEELLARAVQSTYYERHYPTREQWQEALAHSEVRLQWDPDHDPAGARLERRALQLGLRGEALDRYGKQELLEVIDLTEFVAEQRPQALAVDFGQLRTPREDVFLPADPALAARLGLAGTDAAGDGEDESGG